VKPYRDGQVGTSYNSNSFVSYVEDGLMPDLMKLCSYVNSSRDALGIDPSWDMHKDCLWHQLSAVMSTYRIQQVSQALLLWAAKDSGANGNMLGVNASFAPAWLCMQFTPYTQGNSALDGGGAHHLINQWNDVFLSNSPRAQSIGVPILVGSNTFAIDILAAEVLYSVELATIISVAGFVGLIFLFTCDVSIVTAGAFVMILVTITTLCLHLIFFTNVVDLLDIVVFIAIIGIIVDFPIHLIEHFLIQQSVSENASVHELRSCFPSVFHAIEDTLFFMSRALFGPMLMTVISGIPLLFATLSLLRKTGEYMILMIISSYTITLLITPGLLVLCPRTRFLKNSLGLWRLHYNSSKEGA